MNRQKVFFDPVLPKTFGCKDIEESDAMPVVPSPVIRPVASANKFIEPFSLPSISLEASAAAAFIECETSSSETIDEKVPGEFDLEELAKVSESVLLKYAAFSKAQE